MKMDTNNDLNEATTNQKEIEFISLEEQLIPVTEPVVPVTEEYIEIKDESDNKIDISDDDNFDPIACEVNDSKNSGVDSDNDGPKEYDILFLSLAEIENVIDKERELKDVNLMYKCRACKLGYSRKVDMLRHQTFHHYKKAPPFPCLACKEVLTTQPQLTLHWRTRHTAVLRCNYCSLFCRTKPLMTQHLQHCVKEQEKDESEDCNDDRNSDSSSEDAPNGTPAPKKRRLDKRTKEKHTKEKPEPNYGSEESEEDESCWPIATPRRKQLSHNVHPQMDNKSQNSIPKPLLKEHRRREVFTQIDCGPVLQYKTPYEAFVSIWNRDIIELIIKETNKYTRELHEKDISIDELYLYLAFIIATGITIKHNVKDYWKLDMFETVNIRNIISYSKYEMINKRLHFNSDMNLSKLTKSEAKLRKIQPVIDHLNARFKSLYVPKRNLVLDNSIANLGYHVSDITSLEVCESASGYVWQFKLDASCTDYVTSVLELVRGLEGKGYTLWLDSLFQCEDIASNLVTKGFDCVGSLNQEEDIVLKEMAHWRDEHGVYLMSTFKDMGLHYKNGKCLPILVDDYNMHMKRLDEKNQLLAANPIERRRTKVWYKKLFRRLLNVSVLNAEILYRMSKVRGKIARQDFRKKLVFEIVEKHHLSKCSNPVSSYTFPSEITGHFPRVYSLEVHDGKCRLCNTRTGSHCAHCNVPLCPFTCHIKFHSSV